MVMGLGRDERGNVRAYHASLQPQDRVLRLRRAAHLEVAFDDATVWSVVSDGATAYAFGSDRRGGQDLAWAGDGLRWHPIPTPEGGFGQAVVMAAAGAQGIVALGGEASGVLIDPVLWHLRTDGSWVRSADHVFPPAHRPTSEECGDLPDSAVEFMGLDTTLAVPCFGNRDMTFTAWSANCDGCFGGGPAPAHGAAWLLNPSRTFLLLPVEDRSESYGYWKDAIPAPDLVWRDEFVSSWLRVTGHYDDPASERCRSYPTAADDVYFVPPEVQVSECRQRFVVTDVRIVDGPGS
jgi:hypothetical protein